jgi:hypothetical protein
MHHAKRLVTGLAAVTLLCGCGVTLKPSQGHGVVDSPLTTHPDRLACLRADHLHVTVLSDTSIRIGEPPSAALVRFAPTPGIAQGYQIQGVRSYQGAEVIGAALLYPEHASNALLTDVEDCLSVDVKG